MLRLFPSLLLACAVSLAARAEDFQGSDHPLEYDQEPVLYSTTEPQDPVAALGARIAKGELKLAWDEKFGWLPGVLDALRIPKSSQTLVFSKTSLQRKLISPDNPRAIYFNDDIYIGYIPGAPVMEISTVDPKLGGIFYTLEQEKVRKPKFIRANDCLQCHGGQRSLGVPGHFVRSVPTDPTGELNVLEEVRDISQCTPIADRWAGWYVTGTGPAHRGNLIGAKDLARAKEEPLFKVRPETLEGAFDLTKHLGPRSDITALMVMEHQAHMHNYIARLTVEARQMLAAYGHVRYMKSQVDAFLRYLLFTEEAPLSVPIAGDPQFVRDFTASGPRDAKGRSLRELDLQTRMFKYPCSFLIYSPSFDAMPEEIRSVILEKLHGILSGKVTEEQFAKLTAEDRENVLAILKETKPNLPASWREERR
jgi:hypothetical protein